MATLKQLVKDYCDYCKADLDKKLSSYNQLKDDYSQLVDYAVRGIVFSGAKAPRQRKHAKNALHSVTKNLIAAEQDVKNCKSFDELFQIVYNCRVKGFPAASVYDTALRLGGCLNLWPNNVHLHSNSLTAARMLLGNDNKWQYFNDDINYPYLTKADFPAALQELEAYHIENFLYIYKDRLKAIG